jgi:hypothetical protein
MTSHHDSLMKTTHDELASKLSVKPVSVAQGPVE